MNLYEQIKNREVDISIIGLGYVGLPLAVSFAKKASVIAFDVDKEKIEHLKQGIDVTKEVADETLKETDAQFTSDEKELQKSKFHIVSVPTPINPDKTPNLNFLINASCTVGRNLTKDSIVVFESTVYPGVTEEICVPVIERESGLKCGVDFKIGYSPERTNPGDELHRLETLTKVVSGMDEEALNNIAKVYELVVKAGVYRANNIKEAEAAKVIENSQRDINIAFVNELSLIFEKLGIDTLNVLQAAKTKWNFIDFTPGLVGGHCIGVDPYYLTYKAEEFGYNPHIILSGRKINDYMSKHVAEKTVKALVKADVEIKNSKVAILGAAFKENCPDTRNSKVFDIIKELNEYGIETELNDPYAYPDEVLNEYNINLKDIEEINNVDAVIVSVKHDFYKQITLNKLKNMLNDNNPVLIDIKGLFNKVEAENMGFIYWRL